MSIMCSVLHGRHIFWCSVARSLTRCAEPVPLYPDPPLATGKQMSLVIMLLLVMLLFSCHLVVMERDRPTKEGGGGGVPGAYPGNIQYTIVEGFTDFSGSRKQASKRILLLAGVCAVYVMLQSQLQTINTPEYMYLLPQRLYQSHPCIIVVGSCIDRQIDRPMCRPSLALWTDPVAVELQNSTALSSVQLYLP